MKTQNAILKTIGLFAVLSMFSSCVVVVEENIQGAPGNPGEAYFGVSYETMAPYSYWDNNPSIPVSPMLGEYYFTYPGVFDFEYFINAHEYWYVHMKSGRTLVGLVWITEREAMMD